MKALLFHEFRNICIETILWTRKTNCFTIFLPRNFRRKSHSNCEYHIVPGPRKWGLNCVFLYSLFVICTFMCSSVTYFVSAPSITHSLLFNLASQQLSVSCSALSTTSVTYSSPSPHSPCNLISSNWVFHHPVIPIYSLLGGGGGGCIRSQLILCLGHYLTTTSPPHIHLTTLKLTHS